MYLLQKNKEILLKLKDLVENHEAYKRHKISAYKQIKTPNLQPDQTRYP